MEQTNQPHGRCRSAGVPVSRPPGSWPGPHDGDARRRRRRASERAPPWRPGRRAGDEEKRDERDPHTKKRKRSRPAKNQGKPFCLCARGHSWRLDATGIVARSATHASVWAPEASRSEMSHRWPQANRPAGRCKRTWPAFSGSPEKPQAPVALGRLLGFRGCASCRVRRSCSDAPSDFFLCRFLSFCELVRPPANGLSKLTGNTGCLPIICLSIEKCKNEGEHS